MTHTDSFVTTGEVFVYLDANGDEQATDDEREARSHGDYWPVDVDVEVSFTYEPGERGTTSRYAVEDWSDDVAPLILSMTATVTGGEWDGCPASVPYLEDQCAEVADAD